MTQRTRLTECDQLRSPALGTVHSHEHACPGTWRRWQGGSRHARILDDTRAGSHVRWTSRSCSGGGCAGGGSWACVSDERQQMRRASGLFRRLAPRPESVLYHRTRDIQRMDHVGIPVDDLAAATEFFVGPDSCCRARALSVGELERYEDSYRLCSSAARKVIIEQRSRSADGSSPSRLHPVAGDVLDGGYDRRFRTRRALYGGDRMNDKPNWQAAHLDDIERRGRGHSGARAPRDPRIRHQRLHAQRRRHPDQRARRGRSGQEELYIVLDGKATFEVDGGDLVDAARNSRVRRAGVAAEGDRGRNRPRCRRHTRRGVPGGRLG